MSKEPDEVIEARMEHPRPRVGRSARALIVSMFGLGAVIVFSAVAWVMFAPH
jgi:hypothetical protein